LSYGDNIWPPQQDSNPHDPNYPFFSLEARGDTRGLIGAPSRI